MDGHAVQPLQGVQHRAIVLPEQTLRQMQAVVRINADQMGVERGMMDLRERDAVWNHGLVRVLYNLNQMIDHSAYIVVGEKISYWQENKLFIFEDTLLHESINETDQTRYCLFVDMIRPTPFPGVMRAFISGVRLLTQSFKFIYYQRWEVIDR
jgi:hypothetical protein